MKNIILFLSCSLLIGFNVMASDDESGGHGDTPSKKNEACEEQKNNNAFFLIATHTKEDVKAQIALTRQAIDTCETNEDAEQLNKQIAILEEKIGGAPETGSTADAKASPKDYTYGDFGEPPKKVDPNAPEPVAKAEPVAAVEGEKEKPAPKKAVAKKVAAVKSAEGDEPEVAPVKKAEVVAPAKPALKGECIAGEFAKDVECKLANVGANLGSAALEVKRAGGDKEYWVAVKDRVGELHGRAVSATSDAMTAIDEKLTKPSTDTRTVSEKLAAAGSSAKSFYENKVTMQNIKSGAWNIATNVWDSTAGKVYSSARVLADQRNDGETNLMATTELAAGTYSTAAGIAGVAAGAKFVAEKAVKALPASYGNISSVGLTVPAAPAATTTIGVKAGKFAGDQAIGQAADSIKGRIPAGK